MGPKIFVSETNFWRKDLGPEKIFGLKIFWHWIISHRDSQTTTDVKPEMIPGIQTGNGIPHDKCNLRGIAHERTNRKDVIFMQRRLYIDEAHTAPDIFRFAVFFSWGY